MLSKKHIALFLTLCQMTAFAADRDGKLDRYQEDLENKDWDVLREHLREKREEQLEEKKEEQVEEVRDREKIESKDSKQAKETPEAKEVAKEKEKEEEKDAKKVLLISGDVRGDWRHKNETIKGESLLGGNAVDSRGVRRGRNKFCIQVNFRIDYDVEKSWAVLHLQYDNKAGLDDELGCSDTNAKGVPTCYCKELFGSGECGDICMKQAYFGYSLCKWKESEFYVEVGRRHLYDVFDSRVQFLSRFDGILFGYDGSWKDVFDTYARLAGFVVDFRSNHFAWITELGALNIYNYGLDLKYSFIDWRKNGHNRCSEEVSGCKENDPCKKKKTKGFKCGDRDPPGSKFMVSQWTAIYNLKKDATFLCLPTRFFGAFLLNHDNPEDRCFVGKQNKAWYAGIRLGELKNADSWAFQVQYQYVEAFSVPDLDMAGIGNGNVFDDLILTDGRGNTNFKGWRFDSIYAFTDEIMISARYEWSTEIERKLFNGGRHYFNQIKVEMLYVF